MALVYAKRWNWLVIALLCACLGAVGCKGNDSAEAAEKDNEKTAEANAPSEDGKPSDEGSDPKAEASAVEIDDNIYPDFNFGLLNDEQQGRFVTIAKAELCPCPDANSSLHQCLQARDQRCNIAMNSAQLIASMVKASYNETDILDKVAELVENAKADHEFVLEDRPVKGDPKASVVIVEFADFECPYCKMASGLIDGVAAKYGDDVAIYFKQFPLSAHQNAQLAAQASVAAHNQGKFWQMHDALFNNQKSLSEAKIMSLAQRTGLNMSKFKKDLRSDATRNYVARDKMDGEEAGMTGTPTLFFNGKRYLGELTEKALSAEVERTLDEVKKAEATTDTN